MKKVDFIKIINDLYGEDSFDFSLVPNEVNIKKTITLFCNKHKIYFKRYGKSLLLGGINGCDECIRERKQEDFIKKANLLHNNKYNYSKVYFTKMLDKVKIICPIHGEFEQTASNHLNGQGCPYCAGKNITTEDFIKKSIEKHGEKYDYSKTVYKNTRTLVTIICPLHGEFQQRPSAHLQGQGCPICGNFQMNTEIFIEKSKRIHGDYYDYSKTIYIGSLKPLNIICPVHGEFQQIASTHICGSGCPKCAHKNKSKLEKEIENLLNQYSIKYTEQKTFEWLVNKQQLKLDYYLEELNIAIECQGEQHFRESYLFDKLLKTDNFEERLYRDYLKNKLCIEHNITIIYFSDKKYVENYKLGKIFTSKKKLIDYILKLSAV